MPQFVLEIGTEEMPARFLDSLQQELADGLAKRLDEANLAHGGVRGFATPRRITALVDDLVARQEEVEEVVAGPPKRVAFDENGEPTKAAIGFAKTQGVDLADAFVQETDKGEYLAVRKTAGGNQAVDLLPEICRAAITALPFPKRMRWGELDITFGRPIRWLLALLDETPVPFELAGIAAGNTTQGHRVHGPGPWVVDSAGDYLSILKTKARVVLDPARRREIIAERADALAATKGGRVVWNQELLDEVSGLVEWPVPICGDIDPSFLEVPRETLLTSMESHQKSFGVEGPDGALLPHFITTLNLDPTDPDLVQKGWERVLKARLEDARFFWKADLAKGFDAWLQELDNVIFLGPLGSMGERSRRLEGLCRWLAERGLAPGAGDNAARAGRLAKADLVSEMVGEFDDLQGIMGGIYARKWGEPEAVAAAVYEQYHPTGQDSPVPETAIGAILAMADKADTLAGCFGLNMIPTGSADPYALRRHALGICRIVMDKGFRLDLAELLGKAQELYGEREWKLFPEQALEALLDFFAQRLKNYFTAKGYATLAVEAAVGAGIRDVWALRARLEALDAFSREPDFEQAVLTFKRAGNIIRKQGREAGQELTGQYRADLLQEEQEKALAAALEEMRPRFEALWQADDYPALMALLRELRPRVDDFFDHVMVMCEDEALRANRLNLLQALVEPLSRLADFNALQV